MKGVRLFLHTNVQIPPQNDFNVDFERKALLPPGFEPMTFRVTSICQGIAFLTGIFISFINRLLLLVASTLRFLEAVTKTTHLDTG